MRWLIAYLTGASITAGLLVLFLGYGIGGCDCVLDEPGLFCWLCEHQWLVMAAGASPLWITTLLHLRANRRQHRRDLYGDEHD